MGIAKGDEEIDAGKATVTSGANDFWGAEGAPILFSEIGFCVASCSYIYIYIYVYICQDGGAVGFVEFTKLLFALSSLAQRFD